MYYVINGLSKSHGMEDFKDALDLAYTWVIEQAADEGIDEDSIETFENGRPGPRPSCGVEVGDHWEAAHAQRAAMGHIGLASSGKSRIAHGLSLHPYRIWIL